jgi:hypothetical protein
MFMWVFQKLRHKSKKLIILVKYTVVQALNSGAKTTLSRNVVFSDVFPPVHYSGETAHKLAATLIAFIQVKNWNYVHSYPSPNPPF